MQILKSILKFILFVITIILVCILSITGFIYNTRDITKEFISEEQIKKAIDNINILDLLKDENGNELEPIVKVKTELVNAGLPVETVESFINSEPVKQITTDATMLVIDYVFYDKQIETPALDKEQIFSFIKENMTIIVNEMQEHNVPKSELLTLEKQQEVLTKLEEKMPIIEEKINEVTSTLEEKIKGTDEYKQVEEYKEQMNKTLDIIRFIYGNEVTTIIIVMCLVCIIGIILCSLSFYKYFKWLGISSLLSGTLLYIVSLIIPQLYQYVNDIPYIFQNLFTMILNDSRNLFVSKSIPYFIIGIVLIIVNIVIWFIREKIEDKKIDL